MSLNPRDYLCVYDPRYTAYVDLADPDYERPARTNCACDNCFYGRDKLAMRILELSERAPGVEHHPMCAVNLSCNCGAIDYAED